MGGDFPPLLLTIDVGNTSTSFGLFSQLDARRHPRPHFEIDEKTDTFRSFASARQFFLKRAKACLSQPKTTAVMISSVVPSVDTVLKRVVRSFGAPSPIFVSSRTPSQIKIRYKKPSEVGSDRLVNARGAVALASPPLIVVDFGTATTFDCVSSRNEYLGGVIAPGPVISSEALFQRTAKLPRVKLTKPAKILGQNTVESIRSGLFHGYRGLVVEIVKELKKKMGSRTTVLATGGQARWILKGLPFIRSFVPHLTHVGLFYLWKDSGSSKKP